MNNIQISIELKYSHLFTYCSTIRTLFNGLFSVHSLSIFTNSIEICTLFTLWLPIIQMSFRHYSDIVQMLFKYCSFALFIIHAQFTCLITIQQRVVKDVEPETRRWCFPEPDINGYELWDSIGNEFTSVQDKVNICEIIHSRILNEDPRNFLESMIAINE